MRLVIFCNTGKINKIPIYIYHKQLLIGPSITLFTNTTILNSNDIFLPLYCKSSVIIHPIVSMIIMEIVVFVTGMIFTAVLKKIPVIKSVL